MSCQAKQQGDEMACGACGIRWGLRDPAPPCKPTIPPPCKPTIPPRAPASPRAVADAARHYREASGR